MSKVMPIQDMWITCPPIINLTAKSGIPNLLATNSQSLKTSVSACKRSSVSQTPVTVLTVTLKAVLSVIPKATLDAGDGSSVSGIAKAGNGIAIGVPGESESSVSITSPTGSAVTIESGTFGTLATARVSLHLAAVPAMSLFESAKIISSLSTIASSDAGTVFDTSTTCTAWPSKDSGLIKALSSTLVVVLVCAVANSCFSLCSARVDAILVVTCPAKTGLVVVVVNARKRRISCFKAMLEPNGPMSISGPVTILLPFARTRFTSRFSSCFSVIAFPGVGGRASIVTSSFSTRTVAEVVPSTIGKEVVALAIRDDGVVAANRPSSSAGVAASCAAASSILEAALVPAATDLRKRKRWFCKAKLEPDTPQSTFDPAMYE
mmetsp:Transcript_12625/g.20898  ORF Transcript_12625/g.20898 Transcript_12625/m.20898 type:complete len:378 (-) Transcript_12625:395-1528(-)